MAELASGRLCRPGATSLWSASAGRVGAGAGRVRTSNSPEFLQRSCPGSAGEKLYRTAPAVTAQGLVTAGGTASLAFAVEIPGLLDVFAPAIWKN